MVSVEPPLRSGFVFAFRIFNDGDPTTRLAERIAHACIYDDIIHVAMFPVIESDETTLEVADNVITSVVGVGFYTHDTMACVVDGYAFIHVPMTYAQTAEGIRYLHSLHGKQYNYLSLVPMTILPQWLKTPGACGNNTIDFNPHRIFCSQMGLLLCHKCGVVPATAPHVDPSLCSPGELYRILLDEVGGRIRPSNRINVHAGVDTNALLLHIDTACDHTLQKLL